MESKRLSSFASLFFGVFALLSMLIAISTDWLVRAQDSRPPARGARAPMSERMQSASGLYFTAPYVHLRGVDGMIRTLQRSHLNAAVIDIKDSRGRIHYDSAIPELQDQETDWLGDVRDMNRQLHEANIHSIARIVCFNDPVLPERFPDRAIQHIRYHQRGIARPWTSWGTGSYWLDPWNDRNREMIVELVREAESLGFDEIQLDYIRFPVDDGVQYAYYPGEREDMLRRDLLHGLLEQMDAAVHIPIGVDVFGIQAFWPGDSSGLGQDLALWTDHVEVFTPMLYVNAMTAWAVGEPDRARRLVQIGMSRLRDRLGDRPVLRPFLQAFAQGADSFDPGFIRDQLVGASHAGSDGFLFWHPGSSYGMVQRAMNGVARSLASFPLPDARRNARLPGAPNATPPSDRN